MKQLADWLDGAARRLNSDQHESMRQGCIDVIEEVSRHLRDEPNPLPVEVVEHTQPHAAQLRYHAQRFQRLGDLGFVTPPAVDDAVQELTAAAAYIEQLEKELEHWKLDAGYRACINIADDVIQGQLTQRAEHAEAELQRLKAQLATYEYEHRAMKDAPARGDRP